MVTVGVECDFYVCTPDGLPLSDRLLEQDCDGVMVELQRLVDSGCGITDPAVSLDIGLSTVTLEVEASGDDFDKALETADSCLRTAIHATGGHTPGWSVQQTAQRAEVVHDPASTDRLVEA